MNEYREKNKFHSLFGARTLQAIKDILVEKRPDGTNGDVLTSSYIDLDIWLKNADGSDSYYLSPFRNFACLNIRVPDYVGEKSDCLRP